jgi:dTDP-4-dehydrorhamnose 3,5-epimerase
LDIVTEQQPTAIDGLSKVPLKKIEGPKGSVLHILRANAPHFMKFGEVYISITDPGAIKGWKLHKEISQNFSVPIGKMKFVFFDDRSNSKTKGAVVEMESSLDNYYLIQVPPKIWYAFTTVSKEPGYIVNCASHWFTEGESETIELNSEKIPAQAKNLIGV